MQIRPLEYSDLEKVVAFADEAIGRNYFSLDELKGVYQKSYSITDPKHMCSFILVDEKNNIHGLRLAYPPRTWKKGKGSKVRPDLWKIPQNDVAYFQSLFVSKNLQGEGWGPKLSQTSIDVFKKVGAKAVVTHAWMESPNNSSFKYLKGMGFEPLTEHQNYWIDVDYECTLDGKPCRCTAVEMIKYLEE